MDAEDPGTDDNHAPIDRAALDRLRRLGGDRLVARMIDLFLQNAPQRLRAAREGVRGRDLAAVEQAAHSLKSSAANLGAHTMQEIAERLELHAAAGASLDVVAGLRELERAYTVASDRLRATREHLPA